MIKIDNSQLTSEEKRKLLAQLLAAKEQKDSKPRIGPVSFAQRRLWFLYQLAPESTGYNVSIALRSERELNPKALKYALCEVVRRHEVLRTVFTTVDGVPMQEVKPPFAIELALRDLSEEPNAEEVVGRILKEEANQPFDLTTGPLLRAILLRLGKKDQLLLVLHHIVFDGWSATLFFRELDAHYRGFQEGKATALPELPFQYLDYTVWQRNWLQGEVLEEQLNYWKRQLEGAPGTITLPLARPRPGYRGRRRGAFPPIDLPETLVESLKNLAAREGVTLFTALLAGYKALLARYGGQQNIVVGIPVAGRNRREVENLIGFFVNMLVLHTDLSGNPGFRELLHRVSEVILGAFSHQDLPFEKLVHELNPDRDSSVMPIVQAVFNYQETSSDRLWLPNMGARLFPFDTGTVRFDIETTLFGTTDRVQGFWGYDQDLFDAGTMMRMAGHYRRFLEGAVADPDRGFLETPLLDDDERRQMVVAWNATRVERPQECVQKLFEAQVERRPEAEAVVFEGDRLSYGELEIKANQLAWRLRELGVGPEIAVGVSLMPSLDLVVSLLGILKAGGTYVPLDPSYPTEWLVHVLKELGSPLIVSHSHVVERLPKISPARMVLLDRELAELAKRSVERPESKVQPENAAGIVYSADLTEGAKGVMITHQRICNHLHWLQEQYQLQAVEGILQQTSLNFAGSIWELFWPFSVGSRLVLTRYGGQLDPSYLLPLVQDERISILHLTPSMLRAFLTEPGVEECVNLRLVLCSGEVLSLELEEQCRQLLPRAEVYNLYETAETTQASAWKCRGEARFGRVPIGRPVANTQIYLLDDWMEPVPVGIPGEIYIGGRQLSRGYWGQPGLTARRFLPNPYGPAGSRLYQTGDLAQYRADGTIEFLDRPDQKVQLRGVRVEFGQVEEVLTRHPEVETAAVYGIGQALGDYRLVAYVVPSTRRRETKDRSQPDQLIASLRSHAQWLLPPPLVPSTYVLLEGLPLKANGKLDRAALPVPDSSLEGTAHVSPRNGMERLVAQIWQSVLQREEIGIHDNFFDLGGHSLLAIQVNARLRQELGVEQPVNLLFRYRTIADLAARLSHLISAPSRMNDRSTSLVWLQTGTSQPALILVHPVGGGVSCYADLARTLPNRTIHAFESCTPSEGLAAMASCYVDELLSQEPDGSYYLGGWSMGGVIAFEMARQLMQRGKPLVPVILVDSFTFQTDEQFNRKDCLRAFLQDIAGADLPELPEVKKDVSDEAILSQVFEQLQARGRLPGIELALFLHRFQVYRSNVHALVEYTPRPYAGPVYLVQAAESVSSVEAWRQISGSLSFFRVPGNHYDLLQGDNAPRLGMLLEGILGVS